MDSNENKAILRYLKNLRPKKKTNQLKYAGESGRKQSDVTGSELYKNIESKTKVCFHLTERWGLKNKERMIIWQEMETTREDKFAVAVKVSPDI